MTFKKCKIDDCCNRSVCRNMCHKHYSRWQRRGDPLIVETKFYKSPWRERFWRYVTPGNPNECWVWRGYLNENGYGRLTAEDRKMYGAHRMSYILHKGDIPAGLIVRHKCDNPACVNPDHLELGTMKDNTQDMIRRGRGNWRSPKGEASPTAILTEAQAREIKFGSDTGVSLAKRFGVSPCTVSAIRKGRLWNHLT